MLRGEKRFYKGDFCLECGNIATETHHCVFGKNRQHSEDYGLTVRLCSKCHRRLHDFDEQLAMKYRRIGQIWFERNRTREEFRHVFGKNYL